MRELRVALVGFGNVGRRFVALLGGPYRRALAGQGLKIRVTGIATGRHGMAIDARGLPLARALARVERGRSLDGLGSSPGGGSVAAFIDAVPADVLVEITTLDPERGQPAIDYVRRALRRGLHVVTANKGPVAFAYESLRRLARRQGRLFLHESAVMDGAPVFNLVERCLPGVQVRGFRGTLNSTTSHVLARLEKGVSRGQAVREAQAAGIAEADPSHDLQGWDAAVKGCALARVFWNAAVDPRRVPRRGIGAVDGAAVRRAARAGRRIRLVVHGERRGGRVQVSVAPEALEAGDPLAGEGSDSALVLATDLMGEIAIVERGGSVDQTAYGLLSDLIAVGRAEGKPAGRPSRHPARRRRGSGAGR